jgi:MtfA peptidase
MRFESRRQRRRREAVEQPFPEAWRRLLNSRWPLWNSLSSAERDRLEELIKVFLAEKRFESAKGFEVTDSMRVLIAAQACLLVLELGLEYYEGVGSILVHRSTVVLRGQRATGTAGLVSSDPLPIDGQAQYRGPVLIAWDAASYDGRHPSRGLNVVFHEFAHKLDMLDGTVDGTPPLADEETRQRWIDVCTREFRAMRRRTDDDDLLRDYGAQNPGEFFAVATEVFFTRPVELETDKPALYQVLADFYRQDPAARFPRSEEFPSGESSL